MLVMIGAWWAWISESTEEAEAPEEQLARSGKANGARDAATTPRRTTRSTARPAPTGTTPRARPTQEAVSLVYPTGSLLTCSAPGLTDGAYRVIGSQLSHLHVQAEELTGVLPKPSKGEGHLSTQRGHPVAYIKWSEAGCQIEPVTPLQLAGIVVAEDGSGIPDVEVVGCVGDVTKSADDGTFTMKILAGQSCSPFSFREDDDGFAKGPFVAVVGGITKHVSLQSPGDPTPPAEQIEQLQHLAQMLLMMLEREQSVESPVNTALSRDPENSVLQAWAQDEDEWLNSRYEDVEYLLSGDANEEDWRDAWLFGIGM